ncbi:MAG: alpha/beta-type small acid-soluble spore protein [Lachnospiraceae bacterium]|nr:alpha/beta-type small acid-soluble spore protein [Lachnospiraceae bacterium]
MASSNRTNRVEVPEAKEALNRFKQEVASEIGVPLKEGYNGDLTSAQAGSIGGEMVRKMIRSQEEKMSSSSN